MEADYDVVILGAGAAGLSAGLYTTRAMLKTVLLEQIGPGGQLLITDEIENYPGFPEGVKGQELAAMMERQTARFGAETEYTEVMGIENFDQPVKIIHTDDRDFTAKAIGWWRSDFLKETRKCFFHTRRIAQSHAGHFQA